MTGRASEPETLSPEVLDDFGKSYKAARTEKKRKKLKAETWIKLGIKAEEIKQTSIDVFAQLNQAKGNLPATLEKSAELYAEMRERLSHSGRDFTEVGKKQQRRHLTQIQ